MSLGIDLTALSEPWAGMQYFTSNFVRALSLATDRSLTLFYADDRDWLSLPGERENIRSKTLQGTLGSRVVREQVTFPLELEFGHNDVERLLVPAYFGPIATRCPVDMIVYDFLYLREDSGHSLTDWGYWRGLYRAAFYRADRLYPCSRTTRDELVERMPWVEPKVGPVLYPGHRRYENRSRPSGELSHGNPYILFVGTISPRKNVDELVKFYRSAPEQIREKYDLRLVGQHGWGKPDPETLHQPDSGIIWERRVSDGGLRELYENASLLVLPSRGEGFGMPILEAFRHGVPVVLSPLDVFREVAGDSAWYLPSFEAEQGWTPILTEALFDEAKRRLKVTQGRRRARQFSWAKSALRYLEDLGEGAERP